MGAWCFATTPEALTSHASHASSFYFCRMNCRAASRRITISSAFISICITVSTFSCAFIDSWVSFHFFFPVFLCCAPSLTIAKMVSNNAVHITPLQVVLHVQQDAAPSRFGSRSGHDLAQLGANVQVSGRHHKDLCFVTSSVLLQSEADHSHSGPLQHFDEVQAED